ncbi:MAG TPA: aspartate aminotransferase family protein [Archaeoglobaceae archaeon]|nr:aspartate aminotransferase family protein [Archaeoglobaceae archaeon]
MDWFEREKDALIQFYTRRKVVFTRGEGCWLYDIEGRKYLDMVAGIATVAIGHSHPEYVERVVEQLKNLVHVSNLYYTVPQIQLAEKLKEITGMNRFFFCNSGTEAVEGALKFARKVTGKKRFLAFTGSFHGRTIGALSVTHKEKFRKPFEPLIDAKFVEFNNPDLEKYMSEDLAAVILEPVQGEAGVFPAEKDFLREIFRLRDEYGFKVIFDEVQTGFGRTGKWFAKDHYGFKPDIMTMAKAMGSGFPIGGIGVTEEVASKLEAGEHASTFGGNPLACSASLATIEIMEKENLIQNSEKMGKYLRERLADVNIVESTRGLGLIVGTNVEKANEIVEKALQKGLLVNNTSESSLRFVPPLVISKDEVDYCIEVLDSLS